MVAASVGSYRDEQTVAIGISSVSDRGGWITKGAATINSNDSTVTVGVGYQW